MCNEPELSRYSYLCKKKFEFYYSELKVFRFIRILVPKQSHYYTMVNCGSPWKMSIRFHVHYEYASSLLVTSLKEYTFFTKRKREDFMVNEIFFKRLWSSFLSAVFHFCYLHTPGLVYIQINFNLILDELSRIKFVNVYLRKFNKKLDKVVVVRKLRKEIQ